jgi:hypothetical protein
MFHDEALKSTTRYSQGPVTACKAGLAVTQPQNSGEVFKKSDDGLLAEFEKGGDFGGGEVLGFHAGRVAGKGGWISGSKANALWWAVDST